MRGWPGAERPVAQTARYVAGAALAFAALAGWEALQLTAWSFDGPGLGLLPQALAVLIAVAAIGVLAAPGAGEPEGGEAAPFASRAFVAYAGVMVFMAAALPALGFILPGIVAVTLVLRFGEGAGWRQAAGYAAALVLGVTLLFGTALGVPFPPGAAEDALAGLRLLRAG